MSGTHQLLVFATAVTLFGENISTIKKSTETFQALVRRMV
jgi:hypothetical protein